MSFQDYINQNLGKGLDTDGAYGFQCMDLMNDYVSKVLGLNPSPLGAPTAYQAWLKSTDSHFDKITNTPSGVPLNGDIVFFKPNIPGETGDAGHVSIFISGDVNLFTSLDQNYPTGSLVHEQKHDYNAVAGWLHFKASSPVQTPTSSTEGTAAVQFDKILTYLKSVSIITDDAREHNLTDMAVVNKIKAYHDNMEDIKTKYEALLAQPPTNPSVLKQKIISFIETA